MSSSADGSCRRTMFVRELLHCNVHNPSGMPFGQTSPDQISQAMEETTMEEAEAEADPEISSSPNKAGETEMVNTAPEPRRLTLSPDGSGGSSKSQDRKRKDSATPSSDDDRDSKAVNNDNVDEHDKTKEQAYSDDDEDDAEEDKNAVLYEQIRKRLKPLFPKMDDQIPPILVALASQDAMQVLDGMNKLYKVLRQEVSTSGTTKAFFQACGHAALVRAMKVHQPNMILQSSGLKVLYQLALDRGASIGTSDNNSSCLEYLKSCLVAVGAMEQAFAACQHFQDNEFIVHQSLLLVEKLFKNYTVSAIFELGLIQQLLDIIETFQSTTHNNETAKVVMLACTILKEVAEESKSCADSYKFDKAGVLSILAIVMKENCDKSLLVRKKAAEAIHTISALTANESQEDSLPLDSDSDSDGDGDDIAPTAATTA